MTTTSSSTYKENYLQKKQAANFATTIIFSLQSIVGT